MLALRRQLLLAFFLLSASACARAPDADATDEEAAELRGRIVTALESRFKAYLRA